MQTDTLLFFLLLYSDYYLTKAASPLKNHYRDTKLNTLFNNNWKMNIKQALAVILVEGFRPGADALKTKVELYINLILSVIILKTDNAVIHHTADVVRAINATGALLVYLPPYSPDFMPCEGIISQVKWIRENDQEWRMCDQPENMVMETNMHSTET